MSDCDVERMRDEARGLLLDATGVIRFAWSMWKKLRANRFKAHWLDNGSFEFFRRRIDDELLEMEEAHENIDGHGVMEEAADVGNFAMMIHERARLVGE